MRLIPGLLLLSAACGAPPAPPTSTSTSPGAVSVTAPPEDPCASSDGGSWDALAPIELPGRVDHTAVWTGTEMVMWGGTQGMRQPMRDGARYDPGADAWQPMSVRDAPIERDDHVAVWTGEEMIVWGGNYTDEQTEKLDDGGRYDPIADRWRPLRDAPLTARDDPRAVWTGREMIVWGGRDEQQHTGDGARYWPRKNRWRKVSAKGAPAPREDHSAVWTGTEMIVWGGVVRDADGERHQLATGGRYDPATDTWRPLTLDEAPAPREDGVVVWTGRDLLVWGGQENDVPLASGARYVAAADRWCSIAGDDAPAARRDHAGVWTGRELVLWGGRDGKDGYPATGAAFVP